MTQQSDTPQPVSWWARGSRPIWLVAAFWILTLLAAPPVILWLNASDWFSDIVELLLIGCSGIATGQVGVVALVSALRWRTWASGYAIGIAILSTGFLTLVFSFWLADDHDNEAFLGLALFPALLLSLACPLMALRHLVGWRLVACDEAAPQRDTFRIEDLFALTAVAAVALVLLRIPQVAIEEDAGDFWTPMLILCGAVFAIGLFVLPVCVRLALGTKRLSVAVAGLLLFAILVPACIFGITQIVMPPGTSWPERLETLEAILFMCGGATVSLYASLFVMSRLGMSLVRTSRSKSASGEAAAAVHVSARWLTACAIVVAIIVSISLARVEQHRRRIDAEIERLSKFAQRFHGDIETHDRKIYGIRLAEGATDEHLDEFPPSADVITVDLSESSVTDLGLPGLARFPKTNVLILNGTKVSDEGLVSLNSLGILEWLELSDTSVTGSGLANMNASKSLIRLVLDHTPFDDAGCRELRSFSKLRHVSLVGTRVTDAGLEHLREIATMRVLKTSQTAVTGEGLSGLPQLSILELAATKVDDAAIGEIENMVSLTLLDLDETAITDAALEKLRVLRSLNQLSVAHTAVTGEGFRNWSDQSELEILTVSQSAFDDAGVGHLKQFSGLRRLDLSGTQVSDACLPDLAAMQFAWLDVSHTKITAAGILATGLPQVYELYISSNQGTESEIRLLDAQFKLTKVTDPENGTPGGP